MGTVPRLSRGTYQEFATVESDDDVVEPNALICAKNAIDASGQIDRTKDLGGLMDLESLNRMI
jgi:hypothetical protein